MAAESRDMRRSQIPIAYMVASSTKMVAMLLTTVEAELSRRSSGQEMDRYQLEVYPNTRAASSTKFITIVAEFKTRYDTKSL